MWTLRRQIIDARGRWMPLVWFNGSIIQIPFGPLPRQINADLGDFTMRQVVMPHYHDWLNWRAIGSGAWPMLVLPFIYFKADYRVTIFMSVCAFVAMVMWSVCGQIYSRAQLERIVTFLLAHYRCPSCGYGLDDAPARPDGCTVCSECGAAWRVPDHPATEKPADSVP